MAKITEKQLIGQIKQLKEIKPRKEWAALLKFEILNPKFETNPNFQNPKFQKVSDFVLRISNSFFGFSIQKRLAYSFAVILFVVAGLIGMANLVDKKSVQQTQQASSMGQIIAENKEIENKISEIKATAKKVTQDLKANPVKDKEEINEIKEIAISLKTLADIPGIGLNDSQDIKDLYQTIVESQILDLQETTLTEEQDKNLSEAIKLYNEGKYTDALERILLINK